MALNYENDMDSPRLGESRQARHPKGSQHGIRGGENLYAQIDTSTIGR